jgi:hypothetical protein
MVDDKQTLRELSLNNGLQKSYELFEVIRGKPQG